MSTKVEVALRVSTEHVLVLRRRILPGEEKQKKNKNKQGEDFKQRLAGCSRTSSIILRLKTVENNQVKCGGPSLIWTLSKRIAGCVSYRHMERKGGERKRKPRIQHRGQLLASADGTASKLAGGRGITELCAFFRSLELLVMMFFFLTAFLLIITIATFRFNKNI